MVTRSFIGSFVLALMVTLPLATGCSGSSGEEGPAAADEDEDEDSIVAASAAATTCTKRIRVWYDADQYGTWPKGWGEIYGCASGAKALRTRIRCGSTLRVDDSVFSNSGTGLSSPVRYLGWCSAGWNASIFGNVNGIGFNKCYRWTDWKYPTEYPC